MNTFTSSKVETFSSAAEAYPYKAHKAVIDIVSSLSSYIHIYWPIKPFSGLAIKFFHCVYDNNGISNLSTQMMNLPSFQEDSGGPLMCSHKNRYTVVGIISSGKG